MFTVYHSNDLSVLAKLGNYIIKNQPIVDPFYKEQILVQSEGMKTYLFQQWVSDNGIVANVNHDLLWNYIWKIGKTYVQDFPQENPYDLVTLTANIISIFNSEKISNEIFTKYPKEFSSIKKYIFDENGNINDLRMYQTASALADIYDQYQIYRTDWIRNWDGNEHKNIKPDYESWIVDLNNRNKNNNKQIDPEDFKWQAILWNQYIKPNYKTEYKKYDRVYAVDLIKNHLKEIINSKKQLLKQNSNVKNEAVLKKLELNLPQRIFIYGVSCLAPEMLEIFLLLGEIIDVHYMLQNPCELYWGDLFNNYSAQIEKLKKMSSDHYEFIDLEKGAASTSSSFQTQEKISRYRNLNENNYDETELQVGNPLLLSFGKQGRDNLALLMEMTSDLETNDIQAFVEPKKNTLLGKIQHDIFTLQDSTENKSADNEPFEIEKEDKSLTIHSCSSPLREVQVLYDNLLKLFDNKDNNVTPRDIVVMIPKISTYAPHIESVFGTNSRLLTYKEDENNTNVSINRPIKIPYTITDRTISEESPFIDSLIFLLNLNNADLTAQDFNYLLSIEQIRNKYNISSDDVKIILEMISDNKIYRCLDDSDFEKYTSADDNEKYPNNFSSGLDRLLLGSMMPLSEDCTVYNPEYEGHHISVIGNFYILIENLKKFRITLKEKRTAEEWNKFIDNELLESFFKFSQNDSFSLKAISNAKIKLVNAFKRLTDESANTAISAQVIAKYLKDTISTSSGLNRFLNGAVTFCSFVPMRSIPFKHVFMLGMNDTDFPRQPVYLNFDLMHNYFRKGDRSSRNDDRYMFLEAIISAEESLYISYTGRNASSNELMNPSVLITELLNYIKQSCVVSGNADLEALKTSEKAAQVENMICTEAPLDQLNIENFNPNNPSYQKQWFYKPISQNELTSNNTNFCDGMYYSGKVPANLNTNEIDIDIKDLIEFFKEPYKYFKEKVMNIYDSDDLEIHNEEEFAINFNDNLSINNALWNQSSSDIDEFLNISQQKGTIPIKGIGAFYKNNYKTNMEPYEEFKNKLLEKTNNEAQSINIDFSIRVKDVPMDNEQLNILRQTNFDRTANGDESLFKNVRIKGRIDNIFDKNIFVQTSYSAGYKLAIANYIKLLSLIVNNDSKKEPIDYKYWSLDRDNQISCLSFKDVEIDDIKTQLLRLVELFLWGHIKSLPWPAKIRDVQDIIDNLNKDNSKSRDSKLKNLINEQPEFVTPYIIAKELSAPKDQNFNSNYNKYENMDYINGDNLIKYYSVYDALYESQNAGTCVNNETEYLKFEIFYLVMDFIALIRSDDSNIEDIQQLSKELWGE